MTAREDALLVGEIDAAPGGPTTGAQAGLWFAAQRLGDTSAYHVVIAFTVEGDLDEARLADAWHRLVDRTAILGLRTALDDDGQVVQWFSAAPRAVTWLDSPVVPLDGVDVDAAFLPFVRAPFDLDGGPLSRVAGAPTVDGATVVVLVLHHLLVDGASQPVLAERFARSLLGEPLAPATAAQYLALVEVVRRAEAEGLARHRERWISRTVDRCAAGWPLSPAPPGTPGHVRHRLDSPGVERLRSIAERAGGSLFLGLVGAVHRSLAALGWDRSVVSVAASTRPRGGGFDSVVGAFVNQVPLVAVHRPHDSLADLLTREVPGWRTDLTARALPQAAVADDPRLYRVGPHLHRVMLSERRPGGPAAYQWEGSGAIRRVSAELFVRGYDPKADIALRFIRRPDHLAYDLEWSARLPPELAEQLPTVLQSALAGGDER